MPLNILFSASVDNWETYEGPLRQALVNASLDAHLATDITPSEVDYVVYAPSSGLTDFTPFTRTKAVLSLWAGVETIVTNKTLTMPLVRMVDPGMTQSMTEWVVGHVLRYHLGMDAHIVNPNSEWAPVAPPLADERCVCVLGLGALGTSVAQILRGLGFDVSGWSRSPKNIPDIRTHHGEAGLANALSTANILVLLLPNTMATENTMNAARLALLPPGAFIINPGRGPLIEDAALIDALERGHIAHATLDVFRIEPLPQDHAFWAHPRITVTPHIAAETRPRTASAVIAENISRGEAGAPFLNLVDRGRGY